MKFRARTKKIIVGEPKGCRARCWECHCLILAADIRIKVPVRCHWENYHLLCYRPKIFKRFDKLDLRILLSGNAEKIFRDWLQNWNSQFKKPNEVDIRPVKLKKVCKGKCRNKRLWLEVFKFLTALEVIKSISLVCKDFYEISWSSELWMHFCREDFRLTEKKKCMKSIYVSWLLEACMVCKKCLTDNQAIVRCPMTERIFCKSCYSKQEMLNKREIEKNFHVRPRVLNKLKFMRMGLNGTVAYRFQVTKAVENYREKKKERLIKYFLHRNGLPDEIVAKIRSADFDGLFALIDFKAQKFDSELGNNVKEKIKEYMETSHRISLAKIYEEFCNYIYKEPKCMYIIFFLRNLTLNAQSGKTSQPCHTLEKHSIVC